MSGNPRTYLTNAFSLNMLPNDTDVIRLRVRRLTPDEAAKKVEYEKRMGRFVSAVGHADTARMLSDLLGTYVPANRTTVRIDRYDEAVVAQYVGPRLPEGTTRLPDGARMEFFSVQIWE